MSIQGEWENFYVIVGAAAGALIGLQFVVMTLMADRPSLGMAEAGRAFASPTVVHFSLCLLVSALVSAPWPEPAMVLWTCAATGLGGLVYTALATLQMRRQHAYTMDWEDRLFHVVLPVAAYGLLLLSGFGTAHLETGLFEVGGAALLLLFIGIHNAWDVVAYQVYVVRNSKDGPDKI